MDNIDKKKLLLVEDDGAALGAAEALKEVDGYEVLWTTNNWLYVDTWLSKTPSAFHALIFDLKVPAYKLKKYGDKPYNEKNDISPTLYFIEHFIKSNDRYSGLLERIILVSAYIDEVNAEYIKKTGRSLSDDFTMLVDKRIGGSMKKLEELLKEL